MVVRTARLSGTVLSVAVLLAACGERNSRELEEINPNLNNSDSSAEAGEKGGFVVQNQQPPNTTTSSNPDKCTLDLKQDVVIDPKGSIIKAIFSNKVASLSECEKEYKKAVLYVASPGLFSIDPAYECRVQKGEFNVRCAGRLVKFTDSGNFQLTITGDGQFDSSKIRMRVTFEKASDAPQ